MYECSGTLRKKEYDRLQASNQTIGYDEEFFDNLSEPALLAAPLVFEIIRPHFSPTSVIDIGCGDGGWLKSAREIFGADVLGIDGEWNKTIAKTDVPFIYKNLEEDLSIDRSFDLAICLEVAEHLSSSGAIRLIQTLTEVSNVVLFSAAIEGQDGTNHINCQWQSYWIDEFRKRSYECYDLIRPQLWDMDEVGFWYKQNMFLFVHKDVHSLNVRLNDNAGFFAANIVHPQHYLDCRYWYDRRIKHLDDRVADLEAKITNPPSIRFVLGQIKRYLGARFATFGSVREK